MKLYHHSADMVSGDLPEGVPARLPPALEEPLQWNMLRHFDPTVGEWLSEDPLGFAGLAENPQPYIDQKPAQ